VEHASPGVGLWMCVGERQLERPDKAALPHVEHHTSRTCDLLYGARRKGAARKCIDTRARPSETAMRRGCGDR
jgi:hypothetical protein